MDEKSITRTTPRGVETGPTFREMLRRWRLARGMSQLALATEAEISTRHLSFLETGRTQPSREMVLLLAAVLDVPIRDQNVLLTAAGYAPIHRETPLGAPEMHQVRRALGFMLSQQEPFPALVVDRHWNLLIQNQAAGRIMGLFLDPEAAAQIPGPPNAAGHHDRAAGGRELPGEAKLAILYRR